MLGKVIVLFLVKRRICFLWYNPLSLYFLSIIFYIHSQLFFLQYRDITVVKRTFPLWAISVSTFFSLSTKEISRLSYFNILSSSSKVKLHMCLILVSIINFLQAIISILFTFFLQNGHTPFHTTYNGTYI